MATLAVSYPAHLCQTLVGYNYSLLGNWPQEPTFEPRPDYCQSHEVDIYRPAQPLSFTAPTLDTLPPSPVSDTTLLFRKLVGPRVLPVSLDMADAGWRSDLKGARARAFAYCHSSSPGDVTLTLLNFDNTTHADVQLSNAGSGRLDYLLTPVAPPSAEYPWTSRHIALNGVALNVTAAGDLPPLQGRPAKVDAKLTLPPLTVAFVVLQGLDAPACR